MGYKPSPRPTFDAPTPIRAEDAVRHTWGDEEAGLVQDWIYVSSDRIHAIVFGLPPGEAFRHSDSFRTGCARQRCKAHVGDHSDGHQDHDEQRQDQDSRQSSQRARQPSPAVVQQHPQHELLHGLAFASDCGRQPDKRRDVTCHAGIGARHGRKATDCQPRDEARNLARQLQDGDAQQQRRHPRAALLDRIRADRRQHRG